MRVEVKSKKSLKVHMRRHSIVIFRVVVLGELIFLVLVIIRINTREKSLTNVNTNRVTRRSLTDRLDLHIMLEHILM